MGRLACNPLALTNDPTGSGHAPNVFVVSAWNQHTEEVDMYYFVGKDGVQQGQELWLDYGQVSSTASTVRPCSLRCAGHILYMCGALLESSCAVPMSVAMLGHKVVLVQSLLCFT